MVNHNWWLVKYTLHICRRRISNILTMELGWWGRVLAVKETCLLLGGLSQWLTRIRDTRGWKYLHSRTSLTSSPLLRLTLGINGRSTRYYAAESTLAPTFLCLPPPPPSHTWYSLLRICHRVRQQVSICQILRIFCWIEMLQIENSDYSSHKI